MKKQKILVVDDSALNRELLSEMLSDDYKICEAQNGQEAVDRFRNSEPGTFDAILMDMNMPVLDGCAAAAAIRAMV